MLVTKRVWIPVSISLLITHSLLLLAHTYQADIELGPQPVGSTPSSFNTSGHEEEVAISAPPANPTGVVTASERMPVSAPGPESQSTLPTTVDAERTPSPNLAQAAQNEDNDLSRVCTENAQPAVTDMEHRELHHITNNDHDPVGVQ